MTLIRQDVLRRAGQRNVPLRKWLEKWAETVENIEWESLKDVRTAFPTADGVKLRSGLVVTVFNVKGNDFRLLTSIDFGAGIVEALEVLTHSEYDKDVWKDRY